MPVEAVVHGPGRAGPQEGQEAGERPLEEGLELGPVVRGLLEQ